MCEEVQRERAFIVVYGETKQPGIVLPADETPGLCVHKQADRLPGSVFWGPADMTYFTEDAAHDEGEKKTVR